jgi:hypothetical protein
LDGKLAILLEGKSEESPNGPVSVENCRQASGHLNWARVDPRIKDCEEMLSILVTPRERIDPKAIPQADRVYISNISDIKELYDKAVHLLTVVRTSMTSAANEELRENILQEMISRNLTPQSIRSFLISKPAGKLPKF